MSLIRDEGGKYQADDKPSTTNPHVHVDASMDSPVKANIHPSGDPPDDVTSHTSSPNVEQVVEIDTESSEEKRRVSLQAFKVAELKNIAKRRGIDIPAGTKNKKAIIDLLLEAPES